MIVLLALSIMQIPFFYDIYMVHCVPYSSIAERPYRYYYVPRRSGPIVHRWVHSHIHGYCGFSYYI